MRPSSRPALRRRMRKGATSYAVGRGLMSGPDFSRGESPFADKRLSPRLKSGPLPHLPCTDGKIKPTASLVGASPIRGQEAKKAAEIAPRRPEAHRDGDRILIVHE